MEIVVFAKGKKQYLAEKGKSVVIDRITVDEGATIEFSDVSLYVKGDTVEVGHPYCGKTVKAKVIAHKRSPKKTGIKYDGGSHRKKFGQRAELTEIEVLDIIETSKEKKTK